MSCPYFGGYQGGIISGGYYCNYNNNYVTEDMYYRYCRNYSYSNCVYYKKAAPSSGCFITTVVCDVLGKKDDDKLLNNFRQFRDNVMQKDEKYNELLNDYDNIGPIIADKLYQDKDREEMSKGLYEIALLPINDLIKEEKYTEACEKYYVMTLALVNYYGLKHLYNLEKDSEDYYQGFDAKEAGHGKRLIKNK